ncbi:MAG: hypothetical protein HYZ69_00965, partial [Candidatus Colwellbacteria bacterium]|nr:hypothetical protein [Candidatus Colwellbacteria bacterium]
MKTHTQDEIDDRFGKLPKILQDALFDPKAAQIIFAIGERFELTIEKIGFLAEETGFIILGFTRPTIFKDAVKERLGIDEAKAQLVAREINNQVFYPLREIMKSAIGADIVREKSAEIEQAPVVPLKPAVPQKPQEMPQGLTIDLKKHEENKSDTLMTKEKKPEEHKDAPKMEPPHMRSKTPFFSMRPPPKEPFPRQSEIPKKPEIMPGGGMMSAPSMPLSNDKNSHAPQKNTREALNEPIQHIQKTVPEEKKDNAISEKPPIPKKEEGGISNDPYKERME